MVAHKCCVRHYCGLARRRSEQEIRSLLCFIVQRTVHKTIQLMFDAQDFVKANQATADEVCVYILTQAA